MRIFSGFRGLWLFLFPTTDPNLCVSTLPFDQLNTTDDPRYKVFLNKGDHFVFTVGHFTMIGLPDVVEESKANKVGNSIMAHVKSCFASLRQSVVSNQPQVPHSCQPTKRCCTKSYQNSHGQSKWQWIDVQEPIQDASSLNIPNALLADNAETKSWVQQNDLWLSAVQLAAKQVGV